MDEDEETYAHPGEEGGRQQERREGRVRLSRKTGAGTAAEVNEKSNGGTEGEGDIGADDSEDDDGDDSPGDNDARRESTVHLPLESPLAVIMCAGFVSLPRLLQTLRLYKQGGGDVSEQTAEWLTSHRLPLELDLGPRYHFHSTFTCAVSRDQTSRLNPPVLLHCGHAICRSCVDRIAARRNRTQAKCPMCPTQMQEAMELRFD
eukprot:GHVS01102004.1.p1 GENE.GHVS01102004.1~~GHVS01102004.1.p1  ORF type:complete len:224 (-),score=38.61 GHVS01102004.1:127-738(-)